MIFSEFYLKKGLRPLLYYYAATRLLLMGLLLFLLLPLEVSADTEGSQEVGVPYLDFRQDEFQVDGMVLAPSGERLYVLENSILFQYGLNPLRKINSVKLELDYEYDFIKDEKYRLFISNDEKRLIFYHPKRMFLVNLDARKIIKTVEYQSKNGILNDDEFFTIEIDYTAIVWRVNDLSKLKELKLDFRGMNDDLSGLTTLHKINDKLIFFQTGGSHIDGVLSVLDSKTYRSTLVIQHSTEGVVWLSGDLQRLRIVRGYDIADRLTLVHKRTDDKNIVFDFKTREITEGWEKGGYNLSRKNLQLSHTKKYFLTSTLSTNFLHFPVKGTSRGLYHFNDGEMIIFNPSNTAPKYFQSTERARKHMKMKNRNGVILPINDITFEKYYHAALSN